MQKKFRFRKLYFECTNNKVFDEDYELTSAFRRKEYAESILKAKGERTTHYLWEDKSIPLPKKKIEGFYLVHESLFDEILKKYAKENPET